MNTEHVIIIIVAIIIVAGIILYLLKKKNTKAKNSVTISIETKSPIEGKSVPTIEIESVPSASQEYESFKKEAVENIAERHEEAAKIIKESVNNITRNSPDDADRKTKNDSKLEEMREDLENL